MESSKIDYIQSKDNKTIKHIISLQQRKFRQKYSEYIVEGVRAVTDIAKKGSLRSIFIRESKRNELEPMIQREMNIPSIYLVQDPIFDKIEHTVNGQGIIGIAKKRELNLQSFSIEDGLYIALDGVQDPGNLGTIIRTAVAAGAKGIILLKGTVDPYNEKCVRSTMSALSNIPIFEDITLSEFYDFVKDNDISTYVTSLENAKPYHSITYNPRTMIVLGNEGNGVSHDIIQLCDQAITIPMYGDIESLNVSIAAALCMYKVREQI